MSALTPLEQRLGQSVDAERLRTAQATMQVIVASRRGPLRAVRKATAGSKALMLYDARGLLVGTVDLDGISDGVANQLEQFATRTPSTYQRDAMTNPQPVRKAGKTPAIACYDSNGRLVGVVDSAKLNKVASKGDVAMLSAVGAIIGYANERDVRPLSTGAPRAAVGKRSAPTAAPPEGGPEASTEPTAQDVQKALRKYSRSAVEHALRQLRAKPDDRWARSILGLASAPVRKAAASAARPVQVSKGAAPTGYLYSDGKMFLNGKQIGSGTRNASGGWTYSRE